MEVEDHNEEGMNVVGWPLGLPPVTLQMRLANAFSSDLHPAHSGFVLATPTCSSLGSSDLDTESSLFSFQARSITLGSLMGMRSSSEPASLIRTCSLAATSSCSQVSTSHPHHHQYYQSCQPLELCCKLVRRQQFKHIAMDSAKLWNNFLFRCAACIQSQHTQSGCSSSRMQPTIAEDVAAVPSLAQLLQADRESRNVTVRMQASSNTVSINIMYEGGSNVDCKIGGRQSDMNEVGLVNSRGKSRSSKGTWLMSMGSMKKRVKRKYREWEADHSKSPCTPTLLPCIHN